MFKRKRIAVLGVSLLAALGLMSVSAVGAQAGKWTIDGKAPASYPLDFQLKGGPVTITSTGITITCPEMIGGGNLTGAEVGGETYLTLVGCTVEQSEVCLIPEYTELSVEGLKLNASGSELTFQDLKGWLTIISVEEECAIIYGDQLSIQLSGSITANMGSPAVQLPLTFTGSKDNFFMNWGGGRAEFKGNTSMSLTGANAGKVLGTTS